MIGLRAVEAKGYFDVEVTRKGPLAARKLTPGKTIASDAVQH
jgi:hypothetical protein